MKFFRLSIKAKPDSLNIIIIDCILVLVIRLYIKVANFICSVSVFLKIILSENSHKSESSSLNKSLIDLGKEVNTRSYTSVKVD